MKIALEQVLHELLPQGPTERADERELVALFERLWPVQKSNLISFRAKPDCNCKNGIMQAMAADPPALQQLLDRLKALRGKTFFYSGDTPPPQPVAGGVTFEHNQSIAPPKVFHLAGQVRRIDRTPEAYLTLLNDLRRQGGRFAGLSVVHDEQQTVVYFY